MKQQKKQWYWDAVTLGTLLTKESMPCLEAFSENALYCGRGVPHMNKYKTVKEVCALTGLTRKHLYYFHHQKVVQATAYANYSVEGNDGYKLYDDAAVEKLHQIALYYRLGLKRDEIRDMMLDPCYDSNGVLQSLLAAKREERVRIECQIAVLEQLILAGTKNGVGALLRSIEARPPAPSEETEETQGQWDCELEEALLPLLRTLGDMEPHAIGSPMGQALLEQLLRTAEEQMGPYGTALVAGLLLGVMGEGSLGESIPVELSPDHGREALRYVLAHRRIWENGICS